MKGCKINTVKLCSEITWLGYQSKYIYSFTLKLSFGDTFITVHFNPSINTVRFDTFQLDLKQQTEGK